MGVPMTPAQNFAINMVAVIGLSVAMAYVGPNLDNETAQAPADQKQSKRFAKAVQEMCGHNAGWREQEDGSIRCYLHNGKKTETVFTASIQ